MANETEQQNSSKQAENDDSDLDNCSSYASAHSKTSEGVHDHDADKNKCVDVDVEDTSDKEFSHMDNDAKMDNDAVFSARKAEFYKDVDKKINALSKVQQNAHIITDKTFNEIYYFMLSINNTSDNEEWV